MKKVILVSIAAFCFSGVVLAQGTPDGETPANEGVCDVLLDGTPGLYGLCVAYCEAQDCDFESAISNQCKPPRQPVLDNYNRRRRAGDPEMPCVQVETECPCWTLGELDIIDAVEPDFCRNETNDAFIGDSSSPTDQAAASISLAPGSDGSLAFSCTYISFDGVDLIVRTLSPSEEEGAACRAQLEERGFVAGFSCFP